MPFAPVTFNVLKKPNCGGGEADGLHKIIAEIARRTAAQPEKTAIIDGDRQLSFAQLEMWSDAVALKLLSRGAVSDHPVAYTGTNGISLVVAFLACAKAGLGFLPVNQKFPQPLCADLFALAGVKICLSDLPFGTQDSTIQCIDLPPLAKQYPQKRLVKWPESNQHNVALLHCSSGSTGRPKIIPHTREATEHYSWVHRDEYRLTSEDIVGHTGVFWLESVLASLSAGATLSCVDASTQGAAQLFDWLNKDEISVLPTYPALFRLMSHGQGKFPHLRLLVLSGESLSQSDVRTFEDRTLAGTVVLNCYASMEMVWVTSYRHKNGDRLPARSLPIGKPVHPGSLFLKGPNGRDVRPGEIGEFVIRSILLPSRYVGDPARTNLSFQNEHDGARSFSTGDMGYIDENGDLHCIGRKDEQLKIRGFNVQPADVEMELQQHSGISECAVVVSECERNIPRLCCYYVGSASESELQAHLGKRLPNYMIPQYFVRTDALPKTASGKIRRNELRLRRQVGAPVVAAANSRQEEQLAEIWQRVLGHARFGAEDNFFDVGGDSLQAMEMLLDFEELSGKRLTLDALILSGATLRALCDASRVGTGRRLRSLRPGQKQPPIYAIHVYDGSVSDYFELAQSFGNGTGVVGLTADYTGRSRAFSIEEKAREAIKHLPNAKERVLLGYSYGAAVALEIARLSPETKTSLILIDPYTTFDRSWFRRRASYGVRTLKTYMKRPPTLGNEHAFPGDQLFEPLPLNLERFALFYGDEFPLPALQKWQEMFGERLDVFRHPGDHASMIRNANAMQMADRMTRWLTTESETREQFADQ